MYYIKEKVIMRIFYFFVIIFLLINISSLTLNANVSSKANFVFISEFGAGNMLSFGAGYHLGQRIFNFKKEQYVKTIGILTGFTLFEEAYLIEPALFVGGNILNISENKESSINWRLKFGWSYIKAKKYDDIKGNAYSIGPDFLFKVNVFYANVSLPYVIAKQESSLALCIGMGVEIGF